MGEKPNLLALDPINLDIREEFAKRIEFIMEYRLLSFRLMARVEERTRARDLLEESDRFKTEVIVPPSMGSASR